MKYTQLTKEQFEELHAEFAKFLASQKIDVSEWEKIKKNNSKMADEELDLFSDLVWEKVLNRTEYLEHFSKDSINLFKCNDKDMQRIVVKVNKDNIDLLNTEDFNWLVNNSKDASIDYFKGQKSYVKSRNMEVFDLIQQGSVLSKGELYRSISKIISQ